jgi:hypothetical protein
MGDKHGLLTVKAFAVDAGGTRLRIGSGKYLLALVQKNVRNLLLG